MARAGATGCQHLRALHDLPASCIVSQTTNADDLISAKRTWNDGNHNRGHPVEQV